MSIWAAAVEWWVIAGAGLPAVSGIPTFVAEEDSGGDSILKS